MDAFRIGYAGANGESFSLWCEANEGSRHPFVFTFTFLNTNAVVFVILPVLPFQQVPTAIVFVGEERRAPFVAVVIQHFPS